MHGRFHPFALNFHSHHRKRARPFFYFDHERLPEDATSKTLQSPVCIFCDSSHVIMASQKAKEIIKMKNNDMIKVNDNQNELDLAELKDADVEKIAAGTGPWYPENWPDDINY